MAIKGKKAVSSVECCAYRTLCSSTVVWNIAHVYIVTALKIHLPLFCSFRGAQKQVFCLLVKSTVVRSISYYEINNLKSGRTALAYWSKTIGNKEFICMETIANK